MNGLLWWALILLGFGVVLVVLLRLPWAIRRFGPPENMGGLKVEYTPARIEEDRLLELKWAVPVIMRNASHRPLPAPIVAEDAKVWTNQRTGIRRRQTWYKGYVIRNFDIEVVQNNGILAHRYLNPGEEIIYTAFVTLPGGQNPERLELFGWNGTALTKGPHAAIPKELAP